MVACIVAKMEHGRYDLSSILNLTGVISPIPNEHIAMRINRKGTVDQCVTTRIKPKSQWVIAAGLIL